MTVNEIYNVVTTEPMGAVLEQYPLTADFFANMRICISADNVTLLTILDHMDETITAEFGLSQQEIIFQLCRFIQTLAQNAPEEGKISSLTIIGGKNKTGENENISVTLSRGEVAAIVGPTGSGKSRLLGDIECLAQTDTPTGRQILIDGKELSDELRFQMDGKLVAQLSQNMNFVMDMTAGEFLQMHARSRFAGDVGKTVDLCMACANNLAGESFTQSTKVTQLSGGQSRALMIADTAYMSSSPLVLIDEIENAGIDRKKAIKVLTKKDKIVLVATHDPLLALSADRRIVIQNGGIVKVIRTGPEEKKVLETIEKMDTAMQNLRNRLRAGKLIVSVR